MPIFYLPFLATNSRQFLKPTVLESLIPTLWHCPFILSLLHPPTLAWSTAIASLLTPINPLWKHSVHQGKFNPHDVLIFMSLGCSEICSAALFTSAQSYPISKFPIPSLPAAGDRHSLLSTPPPKATQTCHLLECALLSPIPVKSGMNSDTSTMVAATLQEKQRKGSPPQGPLPPGSAPCTQNTSPSTYHYLLHTGHCSLPIPHHIMFIYMFLPFGG